MRVSLIKKLNDVDLGLSLFIKCKMCVIILGGGGFGCFNEFWIFIKDIFRVKIFV